MKEKIIKKYMRNSLSKEPYKRREEAEMNKIVKEIQSGAIGIREAARKYGLNRITLKNWISRIFLKSLSCENSIPVTANMNEDQQNKVLTQKIKELTKALELSQLKVEGLETMIQIAEKDLNIKIRKKSGTKQ